MAPASIAPTATLNVNSGFSKGIFGSLIARSLARFSPSMVDIARPTSHTDLPWVLLAKLHSRVVALRITRAL